MSEFKGPIYRSIPNPLHTIPTWADEENSILNGLIEINSGSINKYELKTDTGLLKLDRVGYSSLTYPVTYGLIPQTWDQDKDMLDFVIANVTEPLVPGSLAELRVIGIIKFEDNDEIDDKIITVLASDKRVNHIESYTDLGDHWMKETTHYFEFYKHLKNPGTCRVLGFFDATEAIKVIKECQKRYETVIIPQITK